MSDDDYTDENGNYSILDADERAWLRANPLAPAAEAPGGCMVLLFGLGLLAFEGLVRWWA